MRVKYCIIDKEREFVKKVTLRGVFNYLRKMKELSKEQGYISFDVSIGVIPSAKELK